MSLIVTRCAPRLLKATKVVKVNHNFKLLSSFVKDEFSGMKYWEQDYASRQKDIEVKENGEESSSYEDLYRNSYNAYISKTSLANDGSTSTIVTGQDTATPQTSQGDNLTHVDVTGRANMVDVGGKNVTLRSAVAVAFVDIGADAYKLVVENAMKKGDVLSVAQVAGILGAKKTSDLIPLCHPLSLTKVDVRCRLSDDGTHRVLIECEARCISRTGVEMEALTGASVAALTIYDMCKAVNKHMVIGGVQVVKKTGGKRDFDVQSD